MFAKREVVCKIQSSTQAGSFTANESYIYKMRLTKRAPDAGDSAQISSSFTRLSIFLAGRLRRPRPSAGNANRWALSIYEQKEIIN